MTENETADSESPAPKVQSLTRNDSGQLVARLVGDGDDIVDVRLARCFPWSLPDCYISVRNTDGKEVALLDSLDALDDATRDLVDRELRDKVFNPRISRIVDHKHEFGVTSITAETDRGEVTFQIRSRDDVRMLSAGRALFRDADGNVYELPDFDALDPPSQKHLAEYF